MFQNVERFLSLHAQNPVLPGAFLLSLFYQIQVMYLSRLSNGTRRNLRDLSMLLEKSQVVEQIFPSRRFVDLCSCIARNEFPTIRSDRLLFILVVDIRVRELI